MSQSEHSTAPLRPMPVKRLAAAAVLMVAACVGGYLLTPKWQAVRSEQQRLADPLRDFSNPQTPEAQLSRLQEKIRANPQDSEQWARLGEYYLYRNVYDNALLAYRQALRLRGDNAQLFAALATVLYYQAGQHMTPATREMINKALALDATEVTAQMLLAADAFMQADYAQAVSLWPLAKLVLLVHFAIIFFALVVLGIVARLCGLSIWILIRILKDELILAYSTASSESVLPRIIEKMEAYGAPASITSFVVPTGYSFNLDGSTLYQSIAAIFIAQLYGIDLSLWQEIVLVLTLMVTSKGIAGVPGVSFVVLLATLGSVGIPLEGLAFIAGVDRILDMARTALNVVGNALAVLVIAKWEHKFDRKKALAYERDVLGKFDKTAQ